MSLSHRAIEVEAMFRGIDHVELYVGNAYTASYFYTRALGFEPHTQAGLETGLRDRQSYMVRQGDIRLVFTNPIVDGPIADHVRKHGDSVRDIALRVDDAEKAFDQCVAAGAEPVSPPRTFEDASGEVRHAAVRTFGDVIHSLIERDNYRGAFLPEFRPWGRRRERGGAHLVAIDHVACCVEAGTLEHWVDFYLRAFGFRELHQEDILTERSAMSSRVVGSEDGAIKFPMLEPAPGRGKSQIDEFLEYHKGAGAQHLAFLTDDILAARRSLQDDGGIDFLETPDSYYEALPEWVGEIDEELDVLNELSILVDRDPWGYLLQVFTRPLTGKPTGFLEIIQRKGARGFGGANVHALFEAVERAQARRGNL